MVVKLEESNAFVLLIKDKHYNVIESVKQCLKADERFLVKYLVYPAEADVSELLRSFEWRPCGVFMYHNEYELMKIMQKIRMDLKFIKEVGK